MKDREQFLSEFLRLEGKDPTAITCAQCRQEGIALFRCQDCEGLELLCRECIRDAHKRNGLHRIEVRISYHVGEATRLTAYLEMG